MDNSRTFESKQVVTMPAESYTDPVQARAEVDLIFRKVPLVLCELPNSGDIKAVEILDTKNGLRQLPCDEKSGMIFVCLSQGMPPRMDQFCGDLLAGFAPAKLDEWTHLHTDVLDSANWGTGSKL